MDCTKFPLNLAQWFRQRKLQRQRQQMGVLRCRLESKGEALLILTRDLEQCQSERDQYKLMADQLRERHAELKRRIQGWGPTIAGAYDVRNLRGQAEKSLAQLLCEMKEQNRKLQRDSESLSQKLLEAQEDNKLLRKQIQGEHRLSVGEEALLRSPALERQQLVAQLETLRSKCILLERDLQAVLDEKEELVRCGDAYRHKVDRLNLHLNQVLRGGDCSPVDVDALIMENRYMQEKLQLLQEEKSLLTSSLNKYKNLAEKGRGRGAAGIMTSGTTKQLQQLLQDSTLDLSTAGSDVRGLVALLLESLNDRTVALNHQRKANKVLGKRVTELESRLKHSVRPSQPTNNHDFHQELGKLNAASKTSNGDGDGLGQAMDEGVNGSSDNVLTEVGQDTVEAPKRVVCRAQSTASATDALQEEDLPPDLQRMLSAAMKELTSSQPEPADVTEKTHLSC